MKQDIYASVQAQDNWKIQKETFSECLECKRHIHNPICPDCIEREFEEFLKDYKEVNKKVLQELKKFLKDHENFEGDFEECILCGRKNMYLCMPCFSRFLYSLVKENSKEAKVVEDFLEVFNYGEGYDYE